MVLVKQFIGISLFLSLIVAALCGCGDSSKVELNKDYMANAEQQGQEKRAIFERAGRNYDSMTAADKQKYLSFFENEEDAKKFWELMASPPTSNPGPGSSTPGTSGN